jgi:signal transduction histidine kinase
MPQIRFPGEPPELRRARQLRERVDTLHDARQRILAAADAERRRIERDLHDGAQQRLVAVCVTLGLAQAQVTQDPEGAAKLIAQAREEAQLAVQELRELARGIHPAILSDRGLGPALQALASRAPVPVQISGVPESPLPAAVETAAYFVTAEALTNIAKHAQAQGAWVELAVADGCLRLCVRDDGVGGANPDGTGLHGLRDRVDALDGTLDIASQPGDGTAVTVQFPLPQPAAV